jgi:hypothetical protein
VRALVGNYYIDAYVRMTVPVYLHHDSDEKRKINGSRLRKK